MGGDIARTVAAQTTYLSDNTFGQGDIHKLITIDTPHLGSPLAADLGSSGEKSGCVAQKLAEHHKYVLNDIAFYDFSVYSGAMSDLTPSSAALSLIANQNTHLLPTGLIAGISPGFETTPPGIALLCGQRDTLASNLTSASSWTSLIFQGQENDGIVSETSQLDAGTGDVFSGVAHSPGITRFTGLGFSPPSALDPDSQTGIPSTVIKLLNTPITSSNFSFLNP